MRRLVLLASIWGWSFLFIKVAVGGMTPTAVAGARIGLGMIVLLVLLRATGRRLPRDRAMWRHFAVAGLIGNALPFSLLAWGEERIASALTAVLNASVPLFTATFVAALLGERLRRGQAAGLLVGFAGVAVAAGVGSAQLGRASLVGAGAAVGAAGFYGLAFAYMKKHLTAVPPLVAAAGQLTAATVLLAPVALATTVASGIQLTPARAVSVLLLGVVGTGLAYVLNYAVIGDLGPTRASLVTYLVPVVAVAVGVVVLREPFHLRLLLGGGIIVVGIAMVQERLRRPLPRVAGVAMLLLFPLLLVACGGNGGTDGGTVAGAATASGDGTACGPVRAERVDPQSAIHVLPGAPEPEYLTEPPTSGPHRTGPVPSGVVAEPLPRPVQVAALEQGKVLIQHRGIEPEALKGLQALGGDDVVVAPNPSLDDPVVATAWATKQVCRGADVESLRSFVADHAGTRPEDDG